MASVVDLDERRTERRQAVLLASDHPALRWVAGRAFYVAHDRDIETGEARCGAVGDLVLAPPGVPLCVRCYPVEERASC